MRLPTPPAKSNAAAATLEGRPGLDSTVWVKTPTSKHPAPIEKRPNLQASGSEEPTLKNAPRL